MLSHALPGRHAAKMGRLLGSDAPLAHGERRIAHHGYLAAAPFLLCQPFDQVVSVAALGRAPQIYVALSGIADAAEVVVCVYGIAFVAPVVRVGAF